MRHLFIEYPYYTAGLLNQWMQADEDTILDAIYNDWEGSAAHNPDVKEFYRQIKIQCPETIFHGTDVGHQYNLTGSMANQLKEYYGSAVHSEDITWAAKDMEAQRIDMVKAGGKEYQASYFGKEELTGFADYPMQIGAEQIFVVDYTKIDGTVTRSYYCSEEGFMWSGMLAAEEINVE